jgi:metacaspase-1
MAARGQSLHIGVNKVDPAHYNGWEGTLAACEFDAEDMRALAVGKGFEASILLTKDATAAAVQAGIATAADRLAEGDVFFLSYSGHGGQVPDLNSDDDADKKDETWVLYDRQLVDDELYALFARFRTGVRIFMLSDSCHSGSVARDIFDAAVPHVVAHAMVDAPKPRTKDLPREVQDNTYRTNAAEYDRIQNENTSGEKQELGASLLLLSGCQDNQLSLDGDRNGLFTQQLLSVWNGGAWTGGYAPFHKAIGANMPPTQSPNYFRTGVVNQTFEAQTPFTI